MWVPILSLMNFRARLFLDTFSHSIARLSSGAKPQTSRIISRTNLLCFVRRPRLRPCLGAVTFLVTGLPLLRPTAIGYLIAMSAYYNGGQARKPHVLSIDTTA